MGDIKCLATLLNITSALRAFAGQALSCNAKINVLLVVAIIVCLFSSCASVNPEWERKCEGGLCGTNYLEPEVSPELVARFRLEGNRVPIYIPKLIYPEFLLHQ
ncbi:MAG: hypothetical protein V4660_17925, partial [Pseudomonadota bacterium]